MKKQFKNPIFKAVLLLLSVVLLTVSAVIIATAIDNAAVNNPKYLILNFDPNQISSCTVYHEVGGKMVEHTVVTENGQTVVVESGVKVRVVVIPKNGLWPEFDIQGQVAQPEGCVVQWASFKTDSQITVSCTNREYTIHALDYDRRDINKETSDGFKIPYIYTVIGEGWSNNVLTSGGVKYSVGNKLELPAVNEEGEDFTFKGWYIITGSGTEGDDVLWIEADETDGKYYIPQSLTMNEYMYKQGGYIYVYPKLVFKSYVINRIDIVHDTDFPLHIQTPIHRETLTATAKELYSAIQEKFWLDDPADGGYKQYLGYEFVESCSGTSTVLHPQTGQVLDSTGKENTTNVVYRLYQPIVYTLTYYDDDGTALDFNGPCEYTYSHKTEIGQPSRTGYNFAGWKVQVYRNGEWIDEYLRAAEGKYFLGNGGVKYDPATNTFENENVDYASEMNDNGEYEIRLVAQWEAIDIKVTYEFGDDVDSSLIANASDFLPGGKFTSFKYDTGIIIDNPVRVGWKFIGWEMTNTQTGEVINNNGLSKVDGKEQYQIAGFLHIEGITLTAQWERKVYTVVLDGQGADTDKGFTTQIENKVQYGTMLVLGDDFKLPSKVGYTFEGYWSAPNGGGEQYINKDGSACRLWDIDREDDATIVLYAHWTIKQFNVILNFINGLPAGTEVTVKVIVGTTEYPYTEIPASKLLDYNTTFRVKITLPDSFKIVLWNGENVGEYIGSFVSGDLTLGAADMILTAEARPAKPNVGAGYDVDVTLKSETEIQVNFKDAEVAKKYDIAISKSDDDSNLDWKKVTEGKAQYVFDDLDEGTKYYIFVRLSKTDTTLEGIPNVVDKTTNYFYFVQDTENNLKNMITDTDGDCVKALINNAIRDIYALIPADGAELPTNFSQAVAKIVADVEEAIALARFKDSKIAELQAYRDECVASGSFRQENRAELGDLCAMAAAAISGADKEADVNKLFNNALAEMKAILANYLYNDDYSMKLESLRGLNYGSSITLNSVQDIKALRRAIADAIAQGNITADSFITIEEAQKLLRALDTVSAYNFSIINVQFSEGDVFTLTLTIPEALIGRTGLQVAYFYQAPGMLELLEPTREGNKLIFKAKYIADFVILADPNVDLTAVIVALGAILLCQLIAIAFVLISRNKAKNSVMHASVALPMLLTVHFLPIANAEFIALGLGIAVILAQIVLMWLLLSSGMVRIFKIQRTEPTEQEVTAVVREEDLQADPYAVFDEEPDPEVEEVLDEVTEEVLDEIAEEFIEEATEEDILDEDAFDEELAQELAYEQDEAYAQDEYAEEVYEDEEYVDAEYAEEYVEEYVEEESAEETYAESDEEIIEEIFPEETEEVYEDEEFIGEAPETYYSIDEEENVYAYDEEAGERISDAQEANEAPEETSYDTDLFDGVFGEPIEQDSDSSNEGGDPQYEDAYGESYDYADAEDAQTEDADREETEGQGTVDPYAYIVEDDGAEVSDDDEMYRYDE